MAGQWGLYVDTVEFVISITGFSFLFFDLFGFSIELINSLHCYSIHDSCESASANGPIGSRSYKQPHRPFTAYLRFASAFPSIPLPTQAEIGHLFENMGDSSVGRDPGKSQSPTPQHRRGYQACDPCRKRKVKCDLGSKISDLSSHLGYYF